MSRVVVVCTVIAALSCRDEPKVHGKTIVELRSPAGWCTATVYETVFHDPHAESTSVGLSFDGGRCGAGAVSADQVGLDLELRWLDDTTLQVEHPRDVTMRRNASGEVLQCLNRKVRVVLKPR